MTTTFIEILDGGCAEADRLSTFGGKGAALDAMIHEHLPVPTTAVVTVPAYQRFVAQPSISSLVRSLADSGFEDHAPDDDDIDAAFEAAGIDHELLHDLVETRNAVAPGGPVVVRSSATTEDLGGASFAGQYLSVLDVDTAEELTSAVVRVWASLWHRAPRIYRRVNGIADADAAMAVLIQRMVPAVSAGVAFTVDPGGSEHDVRIERVVGLGDALVSGRVTPSVSLVPRCSTNNGDDVPQEVRSASTLSMKCETLFGTPQDVEWAYDGSDVWIVQSRAITTAGVDTASVRTDGFDSPLAGHRRYTTAGVAEMLPGVLPALVWSTAAFMVEEAYRTVTAQLGGLPDTIVDDNGFLVRARGRAALDLDHMKDVAQTLPGGSPDDVEEQFFGTRRTLQPIDLDAVVPPTSLWARLRHDARVLRAHRTARSEQAVTQQAITGVLRSSLAHREMSDHDLLAARLRLVDLGVRATVAEFAIAAAAVAAFNRLESLLAKHFGATAGAKWALRVTSTLRPDTVVRQASELAATLHAEHPELTAIGSWADARAHLDHVGRHDLIERIRTTADRAGCQRIVAGRTWSEVPDAFWQLIAGAFESWSRTDSSAGRPDDLAALEEALVALPGWRRTRILTGQVIDVRRHLVRRLVHTTRDLLERRETAKSMLLRLGGRIRLLDVELGRRLAVQSSIVDPGDVVHLHPTEIRHALDHRGAVAPQAVLARRRCVERWRSEDELPLTFTGEPTPVLTGLSTGDRLDGWGASPGRHTGRVRLLRDPNDAVVEPGDVVVARRTDASWSPVFLRAAAVIVEEGGPLSHAAIVAREFGLPAVVNVPGAVARLRDEQAQVTVDGDRGVVFIATNTDERVDTAPTRLVG